LTASEIIQQYPEAGRVEVEEKAIRSFPVSQFTIAFYQVKNDEIFILKFFDGRQDPKKRLK
jgi:plasmid stabilization system protein ParE